MKRAFAAVVIVAALCLCLTACTGEQGEVREKYAALGYASYDLSPEELGLDGETVDFVYYGVKDANTDSPQRVYGGGVRRRRRSGSILTHARKVDIRARIIYNIIPSERAETYIKGDLCSKTIERLRKTRKTPQRKQ